MDTKTKREVVGTLIKAGRRDLAGEFVSAKVPAWTRFSRKDGKKIVEVRPPKKGDFKWDGRYQRFDGKWQKVSKLTGTSETTDAWTALRQVIRLGGFDYDAFNRNDWKQS